MTAMKTQYVVLLLILMIVPSQASSLLYGLVPSMPSLFRSTDAVFDPYDDFYHLANSMHQLTRFADRIASTIAHPSVESPDRANNHTVDTKLGRLSLQGNNMELRLRPRIDWQETRDGFMLTAATPGLSKQDLAIDVVEAEGVHYLEISGQTSSSASSHENTTGGAQDAAAKPLALRTSYRSFSHKVQLPVGVDRESLKAKYEDGLLVITMHKAHKDAGQRQRIAIA
jgi:HSP20 family molecular chaperone IbpA